MMMTRRNAKLWAAGLPEWLVRAAVHRQTIPLETFLYAQAVIWGVWVFDPGHTAFILLEGRQPVALALIPEWVTGAIVAAHGMVALWFLHKRDTTWCRRAALATAALWTFVVASFLSVVTFSAVIPLYSCSIGGALWVYFRLYLRFS